MAHEINLSESACEKKESTSSTSPKTFPQMQMTFPGFPQNISEGYEDKKYHSPEKQAFLIRMRVKKTIEALLFSSREPLTLAKIREITETIYDFKPKVLTDIILELQRDYIAQDRAFRLEEIAQGYVLRTDREYSRYVDLLYRNKRTEKLSQASVETLAIIAYRQPVTRSQIEAIRGVDCSGVIQMLLERQLIESVGRSEGQGKPTLYGITKEFLRHFGLKDLEELRSASLPR